MLLIPRLPSTEVVLGERQGEEETAGAQGRQCEPRLLSPFQSSHPEARALSSVWGGCISDLIETESCHFPKTLQTSVLQKEIGNVLISPIMTEHIWRSQQPESSSQLTSLLHSDN